MRNKILVVVIMFSAGLAFAACPSADLTGDCRVDFNDFAVMASQWLDDGYSLPLLNGMTWVDINDPGVSGHEGFNGQMGKYETTNAQYCEFLNAALASGDIYVDSNTVYGADGSNSGADFVGEVYYDLAGLSMEPPTAELHGLTGQAVRSPLTAVLIIILLLMSIGMAQPHLPAITVGVCPRSGNGRQ